MNTTLKSLYFLAIGGILGFCLVGFEFHGKIKTTSIPIINYSEEESPVIAPNAEVKLLSDGYEFTEGPAVNSEGDVYFTDQPNNQILKWDAQTGRVEVFTKESGRSNGMYFDDQGRLITCADMHNQLWSFDMQGNHKVLIKDYKGKRLNGPNDLWIDPRGGIYFTDPLYKRDYWTRDPAMKQDGQHVYYLSPKRKKLQRVATNLEQPNGIIGTPDGKKLFVADIKADKTYAYDIKRNGKLTNKQLFTAKGSDGMTMDDQGNVYLTGDGVTVFNPAGEQIEHIPIDENWTANVCFGGKNMQTLFITAMDAVYGLEMKVKGIR